MHTNNQNQISAATEVCASKTGHVACVPDDINGWEILRDAINDGALDAEHVYLMGHGYACARTNDGRQIAIATRGGWMLLPREIVRGMMAMDCMSNAVALPTASEPPLNT